MRRLVSGATDDVARLLSAEGDVDFSIRSGTRYGATVRVIRTPASPQARELAAAEIRLAAIEAAPDRLNGVIAGAPDATAALIRFLLQAGAVTGQLIAAAPASPPDRKA